MQHQENKNSKLLGIEVKDKVQKSKQEQTSNLFYEANRFRIVCTSVLGGLAAIAVAAVILFLLFGVGYWCYDGYCRWFKTDNLEAVGTRGNYYDLAHSCFVRPMPNRRVLKSCNSLDYEDGDSIGVVCVGANKYLYINLNNLTFHNDHIYRAELFHDGRAFALSKDTLFYYLMTERSLKKSLPIGYMNQLRKYK